MRRHLAWWQAVLIAGSLLLVFFLAMSMIDGRFGAGTTGLILDGSVYVGSAILAGVTWWRER